MPLFRTALVAAVLCAGSAQAATLIHEYTFNTGAVVDSVGSINGSLVGDAAIVGGQLVLDGDGDYVQLDGYAIPTGTSAITVALQAQQTGRRAGDYVELISQGLSIVGPNYGFYFGHDPNGRMRFTDQFLSTSVVFPTDGLFHDYVLTSDTTNGTRFYIDGVLIFSDPSAVNTVGGGIETRIGEQFCCTEFFEGLIDNVRIYEGALTAEEVAVLFEPPEVPLPAGAPLLLGGLLLLRTMRRRH